MATEQTQPGGNALQKFVAAARAARQAAVQKAENPHLAPMWAEGRRGLKDLQDFALQAFPDSKGTREESGTIGSPTQALVTQQITGKAMPLDLDK